jgi:hypothetical protein
MLYKMPSELYFKVTKHHSLDGLGVHAGSDFDLEDFAKIIKKTYGLKDLDHCEFPEDDNDPAWLTPGGGELYHYKIVDKKLFTLFALRWSGS